MGISNEELLKVFKEKFSELEAAINATEKELLKNDNEFDKAKAAFHFGRAQQIYLVLNFYAKKKGLL